MHKIFANTLFIGKQFISLPSCHSTNDVALEMAAAKLLHDGAVIHTDMQKRGRGQRGNVWQTVQGKNLTSSFYLKLNFLKPDKQFELNRIVSLAIIDTLGPLIENGMLRIKWPNDIFINEKKVAGILIENTVNKNGISQSIIGVGINVNQRDQLLDSAGSVIQYRLGEVNIFDVLDSLASNLEKYFLKLKSGVVDEIYEHYLKLLYKKDELSLFEDHRGIFKGWLRKVDNEGLLFIEDEHQQMHKYHFKEVKFLQ